MEQIARMKAVGRKLVDDCLSLTDMPIIAYSGSLGDPYGYLHNGSDIDIEVWATNPDYITNDNNSVIDFGSYEIKRKTSPKIEQFPVNVYMLENVDGYEASIAFLDISKYRLKDLGDSNILIDWFSSKDPRDYYSLLDVSLRRCVETEKIYDEFGIYDKIKTASSEAFSKNRLKFLKTVLDKGNIQFVMDKLESDLRLANSGMDIDTTQYNSKVSQFVNLITYGMCCVKNIPRSYHNLSFKRKNVLWDKLGIDSDKVGMVMVSSSFEVEQSLSDLKRMGKDFYDKAMDEFSSPKFETLGMLA